MPLTTADASGSDDNAAVERARPAARLAQRLRDLRGSVGALGQAVRFGAGALWNASPPFTLALLAASAASGLGPLIQVWATRHLIDSLTRTRMEGTATTAFAPLVPWVAVLIGALVLDNLVAAVTPLLSTHLNERVSQTLQRTLYAKTLALPLAAFESPDYYDKLERAGRPLGGNLIGTLDTLRQLVSGVIAMAGILLLLGTQVNWLVPLVLLLGSVPLVRLGVQQSKEFVEINYRQSPQKRRLAYWRDLSTKRGSAAELRLFGLGSYLLARWRTVNDELLSETFAARRRFARRSVALGWATALVDGAAIAGIVLAGVRGTATTGVIVAALYALRRFEEFRAGTGWQMDMLHEVPVNLRYLMEFVRQDEREDHQAASGTPAPPNPLHDGIRFENVSFAYPGQTKPALSDVSLHLRPGERLALVGENGAGKSTLARLLLGLYAPTNGRILVDGVDLRQIDPVAWRAQAAAVFQNFVQYQLSARENIGFGSVAWMGEETLIAEAAGKSGADAVVEALPAGYDTTLGKGFADGQDLSLGQWQKLALARAYLREARVLVLDEPAASLDALAEQAVYEQFSRVAQGRTVLLISHRLGSARLADRIVFLEQGGVREVGSHAELVARGGPYAEMYEAQAEWYQEPAKEPAAKEAENGPHA